ncbi:gp53-like domain-containing protein [Escherichia coli]
MHRIDTKTAQKDKFGAGKNGFTCGNPQTGTPATDLDDDYFDMLQEELCSVVEASGASLEKARHDQLLTALRALLLSRKNPFGDIKSDGTVQTALENLQLKSAAQRDVGTGANQIPDMNSFHISTSQTGWCKFPNGLILQWGLTPTIFASGSVSYPIPFPGGCLFVGKNTYSPVAEKTAVFEIVNPSMTGFTAANIGSLTQGSSTFNAPIPSGMAFFAIGY